MKRTNPLIEQKIIKGYLNGKSMAQLKNLFNVGTTTVLNILKRNNIETRTKGGVKKLDEDLIVSEYKKGTSSYKIAEKYNISVSRIYCILKRNEIERNNNYHNLDLISDYWNKIDSYDKAYFLGFLITDGNVYENDVRLQLSSKDEYILKIFSDKTKNSNKIYTDKRGFSSFRVKRKSWADDLARYGVIPRKTKTVYLPTIDENLMPHLLRGIFDGDGWITLKSHCTIGLCGNNILTTQVRDYLVKTLGVYKVKIIKNNENLWSVSWSSKKDIKLIGDFIYKDKGDCYLTRKFHTYESIVHVDTEVSSDISKGSETP